MWLAKTLRGALLFTAACTLFPSALAQDDHLIHRSGVFMQGAPAAGMSADRTFQFISAGYEFPGQIVENSPYSAEAVTETVQTLADGNRIVHKNSSMLYRDSQGRTRREQKIETVGPWVAAGEPPQIIFINDPAAGVQYVLNPKEKTASKMTPPKFMPFPAGGETDAAVQGEAGRTAAVRRYAWFSRDQQDASEGHDFTIAAPPPPARAFPSQQPVTEALGSQMIEGVQAEGTRTTITIPAGEIGNERPIEIVAERWHSPELKMDVMTKRADPRLGETTYRLTNIQRIEPLRSWFEVPPDYAIQEGPGFGRGEFDVKFEQLEKAAPAQ